MVGVLVVGWGGVGCTAECSGGRKVVRTHTHTHKQTKKVRRAKLACSRTVPGLIEQTSRGWTPRYVSTPT